MLDNCCCFHKFQPSSNYRGASFPTTQARAYALSSDTGPLRQYPAVLFDWTDPIRFIVSERTFPYESTPLPIHLYRAKTQCSMFCWKRVIRVGDFERNFLETVHAQIHLQNNTAFYSMLFGTLCPAKWSFRITDFQSVFSSALFDNYTIFDDSKPPAMA